MIARHILGTAQIGQPFADFARILKNKKAPPRAAEGGAHYYNDAWPCFCYMFCMNLNHQPM